MYARSKARLIGASALVTLFLAACGGGDPEPQLPAGVVVRDAADVAVEATDVSASASHVQALAARPTQTLIQRENAKTASQGVSGEWGIGAAEQAYDGEIEGYASDTSVARGDRIQLYVNVKDPGRDPWFSMRLFRVGWYGGAGGRQVIPTLYWFSTAQKACPMVDTANRTIECNWRPSMDLWLPAFSDSTLIMSGLYLAKITTARGKSSYITFVVRDDDRSGDLLFQASVTTYQAYNVWGGHSLYQTTDPSGIPAHRVSFNRPYKDGQGAGHAPWWEAGAVRFLERDGYEVLYSTNIDTHTKPKRLRDFKGFLSVGHDEYWTSAMYDAIQNARDRGVNLAFLGANTAYWAIRLEPSTSGDPRRTIAAFKYWPQLDPKPNDPTKMWRQMNRPESALVGVQYDYDPFNGDIVMAAGCGNSWICSGTGLVPGSVLPGLLGYEVDTVTQYSPANIQVLASSPYTKNGASGSYYAHLTYYTASSGAGVFATGSMNWNFGLDPYSGLANPAAQQMTRNVLNRYVGR
ncbi:MAG: DUF6605 domain-containing protein [Burkholderiaceae bacterium]